MIGTASETDENGNVTTAGDGLIGLLEQAEDLEDACVMSSTLKWMRLTT